MQKLVEVLARAHVPPKNFNASFSAGARGSAIALRYAVVPEKVNGKERRELRKKLDAKIRVIPAPPKQVTPYLNELKR